MIHSIGRCKKNLHKERRNIAEKLESCLWFINISGSIPNIVLQHSILIANRIKRCSIRTVGFTPLKPKKKRRVGGEGENRRRGCNGCIGGIEQEQALCCTRDGEAKGDGGVA